MDQLRSLENEKGLDINIIDEVQAHWQALADHLKLPSYTVENLSGLDKETACRRVFALWLDGEGMLRNWHTIITVLKNIKKKRLAEQVREALSD